MDCCSPSFCPSVRPFRPIGSKEKITGSSNLLEIFYEGPVTADSIILRQRGHLSMIYVAQCSDKRNAATSI